MNSVTARPDKVHVLLVDDDPLVRMGLESVLGTDDSITVVGEAGDGLEGIEAAQSTAVDIVLMDINMPECDGIEATRSVRELPNPPEVIILTTFSADRNVVLALEAGASGFLLKHADPSRIIDAVHTVHAGNALLDPAVTRALIDRATAGHGSDEQARSVARIAPVTPTEREVLIRLAAGDANQQIAAALRISEAAVKAHINRMYPKLGVENRVQAAILAHKAGLA